MDITIKTNAGEVATRVQAAAVRLAQDAKQVATQLAAPVVGAIQEQLSGPTLQLGSGRLRRSVRATVASSPEGSRLEVTTSGIGRIHRLGAEIFPFGPYLVIPRPGSLTQYISVRSVRLPSRDFVANASSAIGVAAAREATTIAANAVSVLKG